MGELGELGEPLGEKMAPANGFSKILTFWIKIPILYKKNTAMEMMLKPIGGSKILFRKLGGAQRRILAPTHFVARKSTCLPYCEFR